MNPSSLFSAQNPNALETVLRRFQNCHPPAKIGTMRSAKARYSSLIVEPCHKLNRLNFLLESYQTECRSDPGHRAAALREKLSVAD
jgi:hypothetical protein